eukprot:comp22628_c1_seq1/m.34785 comp22628_c1_seq1/g.34785  ORF comp22628_c1_seq1/g.34785 comp22628_c1_seq1/m.34785 type:complete len:621 (-) comp22628_c1_seq1:323-2185(-)
MYIHCNTNNLVIFFRPPQSGISIGATLFATLLGGVVLKPVLKCAGQQLGILEHCCFQAAGTAAGGLNGGLVAPVLVLFWKGYFTSPTQEAGRLMLLIFGAAGFGLVFGVCLRRFMIIKQNLVFPDGSAAAEVLRTMYRSAEALVEGEKRVKVMLWSFAISFVFGIVFFFMPVFQSFPIFMFLSNCGARDYKTCAADPAVYTYWMNAHYFGWSLMVDPVFVASAFMVGPAVNIWMFIGALFSMGIVAPTLFNAGVYTSVPSFGYARDKTFLFPAAIALIVTSLWTVVLNYKMFEGMFKGISAKSFTIAGIKEKIAANKNKVVAEADEDTPIYIWLPMLILFIALAIGAYLGLFHNTIRGWEMVVAIILTFPIAVICAQIQGRTNWGMGAMIAKLLMIIIGSAGASAESMLLLGNMVSQGATQTGEILQLYKTGYLVGASPHAQFKAQIVGTFIGGLASIGAFLLYTAAYPCMLNPADESCIFPMSAARAWEALADALASGVTIGNTPQNSMNYVGYYFMIAFPILVVVQQTAEHFFIPDRFKKFMPVWSVFFLAFLIPPQYSVAQLLGQGIHSVWKYFWPEECKNYTYPVAAGLISGGCIATIVTAVFSVVDLVPLNWGMA